MPPTPPPPPSRRSFLAATGAAASGLALGLPALSPRLSAAPVPVGPNSKIRVGFIGVGNRGSQLLEIFLAQPDVSVAALCDVYDPYTTRDPSQVHPRWAATGKTPAMGEKLPADVRRYRDFRHLLEQKDIDAVVIATPDHWHCAQTLLALQAGKDIYVEKPLTITLAEGRRMVTAAAQTDRVVAVGLNRRGNSIYRRLAREIPAGLLGRVTSAQAFRISNMAPDGIGRLQPEPPPAGFDWQMWLGPRADRPYQYNIAPYFFRWWSDYSTQMGNWGVHYMDAIRWLLGETAPIAISAHGGRFGVNDDRDIPDTMEVTFEFKSGVLVRFGIFEASGGRGLPSGEIELRGAKGNLYADENGFELLPSRPGQFQTWKQLAEPRKVTLQGDAAHGDLGTREDSTALLIRNFLDCVKSRATPWCPLEEGHRSTSFAHLANIALAAGQRITWDPVAERVTNLPKANDLLDYPYRQPWKDLLPT